MNLFELVTTWFADPAQWSGARGIPVRIGEHLLYSALALGIAALLTVPLGVWLGHLGRGRAFVLTTANAVRSLPTLGLITLVVVLIGIGLVPPLIALVILAGPPMLVNAFQGMRSVPPSVRDAAKGIGLSPSRIMLGVELPIAVPVILLGVRLAAIQVVSTATVAAFVGLGGLGRYIFDGLGQRDLGQVIGGSILVALLAIATEFGLLLISRWLTPAGLRAPWASPTFPLRRRTDPAADAPDTRAISTTITRK